MQVILLERIEKLGQMGEVVTVKPGYARNYLLPQRKARRATKENLAHFEQQRAQLETENLTRRGEAQAVAEKLEGLRITLIRQAGESGQLYGSVNTRDLADAITAAGFTVNRQQVRLDTVIKTLGLHAVSVQLHPEVTAGVTANVARSEAEAEAQDEAGRVISTAEQHAAEDAAAAEAEAALAAADAAEAEAAEDGESDTSKNDAGDETA